MTITFENLSDRHIEAVRRFAERNGKKTLLTLCKRAARRVDPLSKIAAMRKVAEAYNRLAGAGMLGIEILGETGRS